MKNAQKLAAHAGNETTVRRTNSCKRCRVAVAMATGASLNLLFLPAVFAEGFRNATIGTFDLGRSGGRIAQVDDSTAAIQNPANLVDVTNVELNLTPSVVYLHSSFKSVAGFSTDTKYPWKVLPNFSVSVPLDNGRYAVGFDVTVPYGIATEWNTDVGGPFRPAGGPGIAPYFTELKTINLNPSFSAKITDHLQAGVGLDVMYSHLRFNQFLNGPALEAEAVGTGWGFGANVGLTWKITDRQRLAMTYRSPMTVSFGGDLKFTGQVNAATTFNSQIAFPTIISIGYGYQVTDDIRVESDLEWLEFSRFKNLPVVVGPNPVVPSSTTPENWKNTITIGVAGDWRFAPDWTVRGGYQYFQSPVPDNTLSPTIPDANQNVLTFGLNYHHKHHSLEFAYGLDFYDRRTASGNPTAVLNGSYDFNVHLFSFSYRYSF